jgi:xylulokinase
MPEVREGSEKAGELKDELTKRWNLPLKLPIAAGGGDNAAGAVGVGIVKEGSSAILGLCRGQI